ncbi:hypothetical protein GCM10010207_51150 [Streptomyces atratus]|nr:hypothetical protein GCM10010207_51150 [Streptomyces atratus]
MPGVCRSRGTRRSGSVPETEVSDVVVIGGGQAGLAAGYCLRRKKLDFVILDAQSTPGGAWQHIWDSLHLFSPAAFSSLPGRLMPTQTGEEYPDAGHVLEYLTDYERSYGLPIHRPVRVRAVRRNGKRLRVETDTGGWSARAVVSATGTWWRPFLSAVPGQEVFTGRRLHTTNYRRPSDFAGQRVVVVDGGDSGAQIASDLAIHDGIDLTWVTRRPPRILAADIDGHALLPPPPPAAAPWTKAAPTPTASPARQHRGRPAGPHSARRGTAEGPANVRAARYRRHPVERGHDRMRGRGDLVYRVSPALSHLASLGLHGVRGHRRHPHGR